MNQSHKIGQTHDHGQGVTGLTSSGDLEKSYNESLTDLGRSPMNAALQVNEHNMAGVRPATTKQISTVYSSSTLGKRPAGCIDLLSSGALTPKKLSRSRTPAERLRQARASQFQCSSDSQRSGPSGALPGSLSAHSISSCRQLPVETSTPIHEDQADLFSPIASVTQGFESYLRGQAHNEVSQEGVGFLSYLSQLFTICLSGLKPSEYTDLDLIVCIEPKFSSISFSSPSNKQCESPFQQSQRRPQHPICSHSVFFW